VVQFSRRLEFKSCIGENLKVKLRRKRALRWVDGCAENDFAITRAQVLDRPSHLDNDNEIAANRFLHVNPPPAVRGDVFI
jgi:hypothetical protein